MTRKKKRSRRSRRPPKRDDLHILDTFNQADLRSWQRAAERITEFRVRQHYFLEGLRAVHRAEFDEALSSVKPKKLKLEGWSRIVDYKYSLEPLSSAGSLYIGGRFNIGRDIDPKKYPEFPVLYIAEDHDTAFKERFGADKKSSAAKMSGHEFALRKPDSFTSVRIKGQLFNVFDVGVASNFKAFAAILSTFDMSAELKAMAKSLGMKPPWLLKTGVQVRQSLLASNWRYWPVQYGIPANPQVFGRLLAEAGFDAVLYPSTKGGGQCVGIFVRNLAASESYVEIVDPCPESVRHRRLDQTTYKELSA